MISKGVLTSVHGFLELESCWDLSAEHCRVLSALRGHPGAILCADCLSPFTFVAHKTTPHLRRLGNSYSRDGDCLCAKSADEQHGLDAASDRFRLTMLPKEDSSTDDGTAADADHFFRYGRYALSRGYTEVVAQGTNWTDVPPTIAGDVLTQIDAVLGRPCFIESAESPRAVCESKGMQICVGIAAESAAVRYSSLTGSAHYELACWRWGGARWERPRVLLASEREIARCARRFSIHGNPVRGPSFFLAVMRRERILRLYLHPVVLFRGQIAPIESHLEGQMVCSEWSRGHRVYKPMRSRDQVLLPNRLRSELGDNLNLRYRPDAYVYSCDGIIIAEYGGFRRETHPFYAAAFSAKETYFREFESKGHFRFDPVRYLESALCSEFDYSQDRLRAWDE